MQLMEKFVLPAGQILHWLWSGVSIIELKEQIMTSKQTKKSFTFNHSRSTNLQDRDVKTN